MNYFRNRRRLQQHIKGTVTEVDKTLFYFEIDNIVRIYLDVTQPVPVFPIKNDPIEIYNLLKFNIYSYTGVIGPNTKCQYENCFHSTRNELFNLLKTKHICKPETILRVDEIIRKLSQITRGIALYKCLENLLALLQMEEEENFLKNMKVKLPSDLNFVNNNSELYTFLRYDGLCHNNAYPNLNLEKPGLPVEYLFGILEIDEVKGCFTLTDKNLIIPVVFTPYSGDIRTLVKTLVMIKKWTVFTEVFELKNAISLKYILLSVEDILIMEPLQRNPSSICIYGKNEVCLQEYKSTVFFQINRVSEVIYGYHNRPEIWMEGFVSQKGPLNSQRIWVYITSTNLSLKLFLNEGVVYKLLMKNNPTQLSLDSNKELFGLRGARKLYSLDPDTVFQETDELPNLQNEVCIEDFQELKNFIFKANSYQFFSFALKIYKKQLQEIKFKSWFPKRHHNVAHIGNPGDSHQVRLVFRDEDKGEFLDLYFTNRDNHIIPLSLVKDMVVNIKHVQCNKNKYLRTTVFTSFEILEYEPNVPYSSVSLAFSHFLGWSWKDMRQCTPLGLYYYLPMNCVVSSCFIFHAIFDLCIIPICRMCQRRVNPEQPCTSCHRNERDIEVNMTIYGQDVRNPCLKIDAGKDFFYSLLGIKKSKEADYIREAFYKTEILEVDFCKYLNFDVDKCTKDSKSKEFLEYLVGIIYEHINFKLYCLVDAVCIRKYEGSPWGLVQFEMLT